MCAPAAVHPTARPIAGQQASPAYVFISFVVEAFASGTRLFLGHHPTPVGSPSIQHPVEPTPTALVVVAWDLDVC